MPEDEPAATEPSADARRPPTDVVVKKTSANRLATVSVVGTVILGLAGVGGTILASKLSVDASIRNQDVQIAEQWKKEDRDHRADVYLKFLDKADRYALAVLDVRGCIDAAQRAKPAGAASFSLGPDCVKLLSQLAPARYDFQVVRNELFVYGSQSAENLARGMAAYLPPAVGTLADSMGVPPMGDEFFKFDYKVFGTMYRSFNKIICQEVPAQPRDSCD